MSYDTEFYKAYERYLAEPSVREAHDWAISSLNMSLPFNVSCIDFGCGQSLEYHRYNGPNPYMGIDENVNIKTDRCWIRFIKADYRTMDLSLLISFNAHIFVSLFSSEITNHYLDNYKFYKRVFHEIPSLKVGLVSGFYYGHKKNKAIVEEVGNIASYQTLEALDDVQNLIFDEKRIVMHVPSHLFGDDVYEVWKLFTRIEDTEQ